MEFCSGQWQGLVPLSVLVLVLIDLKLMLQEMAVAVAFPALAVMDRPKATSFWPPWHWPAEPTAAFLWETLTTSGGFFPLGMLPASWS